MTDNPASASYKEGFVKSARPGFARVQFPDLDDMVSGWLQVITRKSLKDKACLTLDEGEQVACILDANFENGCVLGAIYSEADLPPVTSRDKACFQFFDGGQFEYDRSTGTMTIVTTGPANLTAGGPVKVAAPSVTFVSPDATFSGNVQVDGNLKVGGDVNAEGSVMDGTGNSNHHSH